MAYSAPGRADELDDRLLASWNAAIEAAYADLAELGSRFFTLDPGQLEQAGQATVKWFGDPAEPIVLRRRRGRARSVRLGLARPARAAQRVLRVRAWCSARTPRAGCGPSACR